MSQQYLVLQQQIVRDSGTALTKENPRPWGAGQPLWAGEPPQVPVALVERLIAKLRRRWGKDWNWVHQDPPAAYADLCSGIAVAVAQKDLENMTVFLDLLLCWVDQPPVRQQPSRLIRWFRQLSGRAPAETTTAPIT